MAATAQARRVTPAGDISDRVGALDWDGIGRSLDTYGCATTGPLLSADACAALAAMYPRDTPFRSRIVMARHGFGRGEYRYFSYPLPRPVETLRTALYPHLAPIANGWQGRMGQKAHFPQSHADYLAQCHKAGQARPTPLLLRYGPGDYNCLHQDLYGAEVFPLQVAILLSEPGKDFTGGEFVLTEQRPRQQSRVMVVPLAKGDGVIFAVNNRPVKGSRGDYQVKMRHGVSRLLTGQRHTLGIIFHDAT
jgi:hypothetical protein